MLERLFPAQADNQYRGLRPGLWLLFPVVLLKFVMGFNSVINTARIAHDADGIPLESFSAEAARTVVELFALVGFSNVLIALICIVVVARYRSLVPAAWFFLLVDGIGRRLIDVFRSPGPIADPALLLSVLMAALILAGMAMSMVRRTLPR